LASFLSLLYKLKHMENLIFVNYQCNESFAWINKIPNRKQLMYHVHFKEGYENIFYRDVETGNWIEEDLGFTYLAKQVGEQINRHYPSLPHAPKILQWEYHPENGVLNAFGYFQYRNFNHTLYEIYNMAHRYLYTLMLDNSGTWQVMGTDAEIKKAGTSDFIHEVIAVLNQHYTNARH
jgi:hypothetical protein